MGSKFGGVFKMSTFNSVMPDKLFGKDIGLLTLWALPVSVILVLMMAFGMYVMPRVDEIKSLITQNNEVSKQIKLLNDKRIYLLSLDQNELVTKSVLVENGVLSEKNTYLLIKIITKVVSDFGYSVGDYSVSLGDLKEVDQTAVKFDYQKVPVDVVVKGPKLKFLDMVSGIEKSLPVLSVDSFNMTSVGDEATIKMSISAYYLPNWKQNKLEALSVSDLTPNKDEGDVLTKISGYKYYGAAGGELINEGDKFVSSDRVDPFY
jgi:Tfp pilus assembly protein PilO